MRIYGLTLLLAGSLLLALPVSAQDEEGSGDQSSSDTATENDDNGGGDTIRLQSIFVGDKEQPAISYFIPWQGVGTPDNLHWNVEEKHDQALGTVDRDVMLRSMELYDDMNLEQIQ